MQKIIVILLIVGVSSTILIKSPSKNTFVNNTIPYSYTNFGEVPYNKLLSFDLLALNHSLCGNISSLKHLITPTYVAVSVSSECNSTRRARNAQIIGAKGILIASNFVRAGEVYPDDDGNGQKVHITVLFISPDAFTSVSLMEDISISVSYPVYQAQKAQILYFMSAAMRTSYVFLRKLTPFLARIKSAIEFRPFYHTVACTDCRKSDCVSADYCTFDSDGEVSGVGSLIIHQQLLQYDIYNKYGLETYLKYMNAFDEQCYGNWYKAKDCSITVLNALMITASVPVNMNDVLQDWRKKETGLNLGAFPALAINNKVYHGTLDVEDVFKMACESIKNTPSGCSAEIVIDHSNKVLLIVSLTGAALIVVILAIYIYCKCVQKELPNDLSSKINQLVARYATKVSEQKRKKNQKLVQTMSQEL